MSTTSSSGSSPPPGRDPSRRGEHVDPGRVGAAAVSRLRQPKPHFSNRARVRSLLMLVVLIPTLGMVVLATLSASESWARRQASTAVEVDAERLQDLVDARAAVTDEQVYSTVLTIGAELGASAPQLEEMYGIDFEQELTEARAAVDADPVLAEDPALADDRSQLGEFRSLVDSGSTDSREVGSTFTDIGANLDALWRAQFQRLERSVADEPLPGLFGVRLEDVEHSYAAFNAGSARTQAVIAVLTGRSDPAATQALLAADARFETAAAELDSGLGPDGARAWATFTADPSVQAFEATTDQAVDISLTGSAPLSAATANEFGDALFAGVRWASALTDVVSASSSDLSAAGVGQEVEARRDFQTGVAIASLLAIISLAAAAILARSVSDPLKELAANARSIREGRFDLDPVDPRGPKELADTAAAFNEMVVALEAVEARAVAMADDLDAAGDHDPIPGRTGEALDRAFDLLRESIRSAETSRLALQELATRDGLTGLLNRTAALDAITRDLALAARDGGWVMVLFIDLDGLKAINDTYGHAIGDEVIRRTAEVLGASTRSSDVVARLGGDEFLVAGYIGARVSANAARERIRGLAQDLTNALEATTVEVEGDHLELRCSIGIAVSRSGELSARSVIGRADVAMYAAKDDDDRSIAWDDLTPHRLGLA